MHFDPKLWKFTAGLRARMATTVGLGVIATVVGMVRLGLLGWLIGLLFAGYGWNELIGPAIGVMAAMVLRGFLEHWRTEMAHETAARVQVRLRLALFDQLDRLGPAYLTEERTGDVLLSLVEGVEQLEIYFGRYLPQVFVAALSPFVVFAVTLWLDVQVALVLLVFAIITLIAPSAFHRWDAANAKRRQRAYGAFAADFLDSLQGLTTLKAFGQSKNRGDRLAERAHDVFQRTMWVLATNAAARGITDTGLAIGAAAALALGAYRVEQGEMTITALLIILMMGIEVFRPQRDLRALLHHGMLGQAAANGILAILQAQPRLTPGSLTPAQPTPPSLAFEAVDFSYPDTELKAHQQLDFAVQAGQRVGFVGASGSGKSTIVKLLLRLYDPQAGRVVLGGYDLRELSSEHITGQLAVVSQDGYLFHGTVRDNLLLAKPNCSEQELLDASRTAHAHEFIEQLPNGYDTVIGERGVRLSGGQRQRLSIARALLKDAPILVLDEALSAVDARNEARILEALEAVMRSRTTIVIAHRLSSVRHCDIIHVLDRGQIVESGSHDELISRAGPYRELMAAQARESADSLNPLDSGAEELDSAPRPDLDAHDEKVMHELDSTEIISAHGMGWGAVLRALLRHAQPWRNRLIAVLGLGISRVLALIGVGVLSALAVAAVRHNEAFAPYLWALLIVAPAAGVLHWLESWLAHDMAFRMLAEMRIALYRKLDELAPAFMLRRRSGDVVAMATHDVELIEYFFAHTIAPAFVALLVPALALVVLIQFGWIMALALLPFLGWVAISPFLRRDNVDKLGADARESLAELNATAVDTLQGMAEIQALNAQSQRRDTLEKRNRAFLQARLPFFSELSRQDAMLETATGLGGLAVVVSGAVLVSNNSLDPAILPLLTLLALSAFLPISEIAQVSRQLAETLGATRRIEAVNNAIPAVSDQQVSEVASSQRPQTTSGPALRLDSVQFSYLGPQSDQLALQSVSFEIERGATVALVGPSGAGKTTVAQLCMRFFDPSAGHIYLDGLDLRDWRLDELRERIALVTQDTYLFNDTLEANVRLARPDASAAELEQAIERASLAEFVSEMPNGLQTRVGERGTRLSGGQRQRVAIARAFLRDAPILLLDEATSSLDALNEAHVHAALEALMRDRSALVIAHRLSTVRNADKIVVLEQGRVIEQGKHDELLANDGLYATLVGHQLAVAS